RGCPRQRIQVWNADRSCPFLGQSEPLKTSVLVGVLLQEKLFKLLAAEAARDLRSFGRATERLSVERQSELQGSLGRLARDPHPAGNFAAERKLDAMLEPVQRELPAEGQRAGTEDVGSARLSADTELDSTTFIGPKVLHRLSVLRDHDRSRGGRMTVR